MKSLLKFAALLEIACVLHHASAGTVITDNLPPNTAIVNINGQADGAAAYNGDQSLWYQPFSIGTLPELTVPPGTYSFRIVDPADAARLYPGLSTAQTNQIYTAWTYNSPWVEDYLVYDSSALGNNSIPQIFDGAPDPVSSGSAQAAYDHAVATGYYNKIRTGPSGRDGTVFTNNYTFTNATTLVFVIPDYDVYDNGGGVSVLVSPMAVLNIVPGAGIVSLQWTTNVTGFTLSQTTNLYPAAWHDVTTLPTVINFNYSVPLPIDLTTNRFFRLHNP